MGKIGRLLTAMVTPFDDRGEVDYQQAKRLALFRLPKTESLPETWMNPY